MKPSRQAKYRQVEEFLRLLDASITEAIDKGHLRRPTTEEPLRIVDLGCGNAYLTFAAQRFLTDVRDLPVRLTGVDVKEQSREHNSEVAAGLGVDAEFVVGSIGGARLDLAPEVVLALHACDTATDEALARAVEWEAPLVLAAPCCHHDIAAQLRRSAHARAVRHAHPARHPARAARRHPDRRAAGLAAAAAGLPGRRRAVRREQAHAAQHDAAGRAHRRPGEGRRRPQGVRRPGRHVGSGRSWPSCWSGRVREWCGRGRGGAAVRARQRPRRRTAGRDVAFRFQDPAIVESSGLVVAGRARSSPPTTPATPAGSSSSTRRPASTVGVTTWPGDPEDVEALAPAGPGAVWVGDIGDNAGVRDSVPVTGAGRADRPVDVDGGDLRARYPDGAATPRRC